MHYVYGTLALLLNWWSTSIRFRIVLSESFLVALPSQIQAICHFVSQWQSPLFIEEKHYP